MTSRTMFIMPEPKVRRHSTPRINVNNVEQELSESRLVAVKNKLLLSSTIDFRIYI